MFRTRRKGDEMRNHRYQLLMDTARDIILFLDDEGCVIDVSHAATLAYGYPYSELLSMSIHDLRHPSTMAEVTAQMAMARKGILFETLHQRRDGSAFPVEVSSICRMVDGEPIWISIIRDITERKQELARAAALQQRHYMMKYPMLDRLKSEVLYLPAQTISGDVVDFHRISENLALGLVADGTGRGISAAINISAIRMAFHESCMAYSEPIAILQRLNDLVYRYFGDGFIAACCFAIDLHRGRLTVASAGVHRFHHITQDERVTERTVAGSPLGMFSASEFDHVVIDLIVGDTLWFYTDGVEPLLRDTLLAAQVAALPSLSLQKKYIQEALVSMKLDDDCTWWGIEVE